MRKYYLQVGQYKAAYTEVGQGEPIIFLHGFFGDGWTLHPIMKSLAKDYTCIGLDLLGFGESSKPKISYLIENQVNFLSAFINAKNITNHFVAGYSYGAWVAASYAVTASKTGNIDITHAHYQVPKFQNNPGLKGLTLIAPTGIRDDSFAGRYNHLKPLLWDTKFVDFILMGLSPLAFLLGQGSYFGAIRQARRSIASQPAAKSFLKNRLKLENTIDTVEQNIHNIAAPTLVIAGEQDPHIPLWHCQTYADNIPEAKLEIIPNAAHDLVQTHEQKIANLIQSYWQSKHCHPNP